MGARCRTDNLDEHRPRVCRLGFTSDALSASVNLLRTGTRLLCSGLLRSNLPTASDLLPIASDLLPGTSCRCFVVLLSV